MAKRYYWLKLMENFFRQKEIIKLRKIAGGDTYTIIYQEMMLMSLQNGGKLYFDDFGEDIAEEIALELNESVENVRITISYLTAHGLMTACEDENEYLLEKVPVMTGSESAAAERMRRYRDKDKLLGNKNSSELINMQKTEKVRNIVTPQLRYSDVEIEIEKDIDIKKEINKEKVTKRKKFIPPSLEDVEAYASSRNSSVNPRAFWEYYDAGDWKDAKGNQVKNWKQKFLTWEKRNPIPSQSEPKAKKYQNADNFIYEDIFDNPPPYTYEEGLKQEENDLF